MVRSVRIAFAALAVLSASFPQQAAAASVAPPGLLQQFDVDTLVSHRAASLEIKRKGAPAELKQLLSTEGKAPHLAEDPSFAQLLSLATSSKLVSSNGNVFTIGLTPFLAYSIARPELLESNDRYNAPGNVWMRRFGGSLSFGGKGEFARKDSAGKSLPVPVAEDLRDIVNWELRVRVYGSRDRREIGPERQLMRIDALKLDAHSLARRAVSDTLIARAGVTVDSTGSTYLDAKKARAAVNDPALAELLLNVANSDAGLAREIRRAQSDMDGALTVTLSAGATNQRAVFGPRRWKAAVSAAKGIAVSRDIVWDATVSGVAKRTQGVKGGSDTTSTELALKLTHSILKKWLGFSNGMPLSLEYSTKFADHVPQGGFSAIHSALAAIELPVSDAAKATVSLGWANHADVLNKSDLLIGHFGLSYDFSGLFKADDSKVSK